MAKAVPTRELGYVSSSSAQSFYGQGIDLLVDADEITAALMWPNNLRIYDQMRREDSQVAGVLRAVTLPIRRTQYRINKQAARPEVVQLVAEDLGLPVLGEDPAKYPRRRSQSFSWQNHLRQALFYLHYGHMFFEQVYDVSSGMARLAKLAPRMPRTIYSIQVASDGGLISIEQIAPGVATGAMTVTIPVRRLVGYVHEMEGANWLGTALTHDTPVPTPDGWRTMGELRPGDRVFDENGMVRHVVDRKEWSARPVYRVTFGDGESVVADENHLWLTHDFRYRCQGRGSPQVRTTKQIAESVTATKSGTTNHAIPLAKPAQHVAQHLAVDPYVLGYWLGDGCKGSGRIVTADEQVIDLFAERGYVCSHTPRADRQWGFKGLATDLRHLGVLDHKHVPEQYLRGSVEQRLDLLRGLMDSDGTITREGQCVFSNTDSLLVSAVLELVRSLGIRASKTIRRQAGHTGVGWNGLTITSTRDIWHVQFATHMRVFGLDRKAERLRPDNIRRRNHMIKSVERVEDRDTVCIEVDSPSHLYLVGRNYVPTHNSLLRPAYKHWLIKDRLLRVQAQAIERNGMGIPVYTGAEDKLGEDLADGLATAGSIRAGDNSGTSIPAGSKLELMGVTGTLPNAMEPVNYHDQQIARTMLAHFLNLGTQTSSATGSYNLGAQFADFFAMSLQTVAEHICDVVTQHVIEDMVTLNWGEDEPCPRLVCDDIGSQHDPTAQAILMLAQAGALEPDRTLEQFLRLRFGLPMADLANPMPAAADAAANPQEGA